MPENRIRQTINDFNSLLQDNDCAFCLYQIGTTEAECICDVRLRNPRFTRNAAIELSGDFFDVLRRHCVESGMKYAISSDGCILYFSEESEKPDGN